MTSFSYWKRLPALLVSAVALVMAAGCQSRLDRVKAQSLKPDKERKTAAAFSLKDADGKQFRLSEFKGKVVLLNFWATSCGPCKIEIPWLMDFEKEYKDKGFAVIGVALDDEGWEVVKPYIAAKKINYRIAVGTEELAREYGGVDAIPTTYLIDRDGKIATVHVGLISKSEYRNDIVQLLEETTGAAQ
jgi:thiol-disulfide isomerase/thioredoxin